MEFYALARLKAYDALASVALDAEGQPVSEWWPLAYALGRAEDPRAAAALTALTRSGGDVHARVRGARAGPRESLSGSYRVLLPLAEDVARQPLVALEAVRALAALEAREAAPVLCA